MIRKNIPNSITCGNLLCGCLAIVNVFDGKLEWVAYFVGIALILDFLDGFFARLLKVSSPIGKDLDSLADMVTFGVVPGLVMFYLIRQGVILDQALIFKPAPNVKLLPYLAFIIPVFSAIRLAKFNNDKRQSDSFIGLPTPANAMLICSLPLIYNANNNLEHNNLNTFILSPYFLCFISCIMSLLLVAPLPLIALKFKNFSWVENKMRFILLALSIIMLAVFQLMAIPLIIILYILLSIVHNIFFKKKV